MTVTAVPSDPWPLWVAFESATQGRTIYINPSQVMLVAHVAGVQGAEIVMLNGHAEKVVDPIGTVMSSLGY